MGKTETQDGYFQYVIAMTHHTTNKLEVVTDIHTSEWEVKGHDSSKSICGTKGTLTFTHNKFIHHLEECLYDPTYSDLLSGQRINHQYSLLNIEINGFRGSTSSKGTKMFDLEIDGLGGIWIRGEWGPDIKKA